VAFGLNELLGRKVAEPQTRENNHPKAEATGRNPEDAAGNTRWSENPTVSQLPRGKTGRHASQIRKEPEHQDHDAADYRKPGNRRKGDGESLD
jgi:hypothetical protein